MSDEYSLTLRQIDGARGDLYALHEDFAFLKMRLDRLPTRAYFTRRLLMATASIWALLGALALLLTW